jgi:hypothetical protein
MLKDILDIFSVARTEIAHRMNGSNTLERFKSDEYNRCFQAEKRAAMAIVG